MRGRLFLCAVGVLAGCGHARFLIGEPTGSRFSVAEAEYLKAYEDALADLAKKSPTAKRLQAFYRQHARPARFEGSHDIVAGWFRKGDFFIIPAVDDTIEINQPAFLYGLFHSDVDALILRWGVFAPLTRGLIIAHELNHADRHLNGKLSFEGKRAWVHEETVTLLAVDTILNEYTDGGWQRFSSELFARRRLPTGLLAPDAPIDSLLPREQSALRTLFPDLGAGDYVLLDGCLLLALNLRLAATVSEEPSYALFRLEQWVERHYPHPNFD